MAAIMQGVRVLEVAQWTFVPSAGAILADWGADVIKVEHPVHGDAQRGLRQLGAVSIDGPVNPVMEHANRGKRSIGLDIRSGEGTDLLYEIAATSDVFLTNFLPEVRRRLGIDVADIRAANPSIIYARGTAYGTEGPHGEHGGYDMTGFWSRGGSSASATPSDLDGVISQPGPAYGDSLGGMAIAGGIAAALFARERTGEPSIVDSSLLAVGTWAMGVAVDASLQNGQPWRAGPGGANVAPTNPLTGTYRTSDGRFLAVSMLQGFRYWGPFCRHIGRGDLADDERFASHESLVANTPAAIEELRAELASRTLAEWCDLLEDFDGQWAPVQDTVELAHDPQVRANGIVVPVQGTSTEDFELVASPVRFDETDLAVRPAPDFAVDTDDVLAELGLDQDRIIALKAEGVIT